MQYGVQYPEGKSDLCRVQYFEDRFCFWPSGSGQGKDSYLHAAAKLK
jgi:hypothetical protein